MEVEWREEGTQKGEKEMSYHTKYSIWMPPIQTVLLNVHSKKIKQKTTSHAAALFSNDQRSVFIIGPHTMNIVYISQILHFTPSLSNSSMWVKPLIKQQASIKTINTKSADRPYHKSTISVLANCSSRLQITTHHKKV